MKNLKKILALVLTLAMVLSLSAVVFADDDTGDTTENPLAGHTFTAYQIFSGTQTETEGDYALGNIEWGSGINAEGDTGFLKALKESTAFGSSNPFASCTTAKSVAEVMTGTDWADNSANAKAFAALAHNYVTGDGATPGDSLDAGYYLVVDETAFTSENPQPESFAYNLSLLQLTKKSTFDVTPKIGVPEVTKTVDGAAVNEAAVGETVNYVLTGTMPTNIGDYKEYYYQFNDTMSKGLTYNEDLSIMIGTVDVTDYFFENVGTYSATDGTTIKATIGDLLALNNLDGVSIGSSTTVVITYTATVNKNAVIAGEGNPNEVTLKYSNKPNDSGVGYPKDEDPEMPTAEPSTTHPTGETPKDEVKTFVTEVTVLKTDGTSALTGAEFKLTSSDMKTVKLSNGWTFVSDNDGTYYKLTNGSYTEEAPHTSDYMVVAEDGAYVEGESTDETLKESDVKIGDVTYRLIGNDESLAEDTIRYTLMNPNEEDYALEAGMFSKVNGEEWVDSTGSTDVKAFVDSTGTLTFTGLGAGSYTLTETTTPAGYNTISPITFTISFEADEDGALKGEFEITSETNFTATENTFSVNVVNQKGSTLPETGGIGTTIFYALGGILLVGAGVLLITKKRMGVER